MVNIKLLSQDSLATILVFFVFTLTFLLSPYNRSRFAYSRIEWQRLLLISGTYFICFHFIVVLINIGLNVEAYLLDKYLSAMVPDFLNQSLNYSFNGLYCPAVDDSSDDYRQEECHESFYLSTQFLGIKLALIYRIYYITFKLYIFNLLVLVWSRYQNGKPRKVAYNQLILACKGKANLAWWGLSLDSRNVEYLKVLRDANVPFHWIHIPIKYVQEELLNQWLDICSSHQYSTDEQQEIYDRLVDFASNIIALHIATLAINVSTDEAAKIFESQSNEKNRAKLTFTKIGSSDWKKRVKEYAKLFVFYPFTEQNLRAIRQFAWTNASDLTAQLYLSMESRSTKESYCEEHQIDSEEVIDINPQQSMVSIHMKNGRIYCGWVVCSTKPGMAHTGISFLPYVTKVRSDSGNNPITSHYSALIWDSARERVLERLPEAIEMAKAEAMPKLPGEFELFDKYKEWLDSEYKAYIFCSDGKHFEFETLNCLYDDYINSFTKSILLEDVEQIQQYNPTLSSADFERISLFDRGWQL